jgi:hypothetical protein
MADGLLDAPLAWGERLRRTYRRNGGELLLGLSESRAKLAGQLGGRLCDWIGELAVEGGQGV